MTAASLKEEVKEMIPPLLKMARDMTWNKISDNCKFIISEIKDDYGNILERLKKENEENKKKVPLSFDEMISQLQAMYHHLYDINLFIYKAKKDLTIINVMYYPKSVPGENPPMLHCKVSIPLWVNWPEKKKKFDINWERQVLLTSWKMKWSAFSFRYLRG